MRKIVLFSLILGIILLGSGYFYTVSYAQQFTPGQGPGQGATPSGPPPPPDGQDADDCSSLWSFDYGICAKMAAAYLAYFVLVGISWAVGVAGIFFDTVLKFTVVNMKQQIDGMTAIGAGWKVVRDLGNIVFIFTLVYIAIKTILGLNDWDTKRLLRNLIIVGLLVNFSLFFTKFAIDISNVLSITFYDKITGGNTSFATFSEQFTTPLGIQNIYGGDQSSADNFVNSIRGDWLKIVVVAIGGSIFLLAVALTFFYASMLFVIRYIALIILMILSPVPFFTAVLPGTKKYAAQWRDSLVGQLTFAPLYLLLIYIVGLLANGLLRPDDGTRGNILGDLIIDPTKLETAGYAGVQHILNFIIIIALLNAAAIIATQVSKKSGGLVSGAVNTASRTMGHATFGATGLVLRDSIGARGHMVANDEKLKERAAQGGIRGAIASARLNLANKAAKASYDARATDTYKTFAKKADVDLGKPAGKGGYDQYMKNVEKKETEYANKVVGEGEMIEHSNGTFEGTQRIRDAANAEAEQLEEVRKDPSLKKKKSDEIYKRKLEEAINADPGSKVVTRKYVYAKQVLMKGTPLQRLVAQIKAPLDLVARGIFMGKIDDLLEGNINVQRTYENTFRAYAKAAEKVMKQANIDVNKKNLPRLEREARELERAIDDLESTVKRLEKKRDSGTTLTAAQSTELDRAIAQIPKSKEELYERRRKIAEAKGKEQKDGGKKGKDKDKDDDDDDKDDKKTT